MSKQLNFPRINNVIISGHLTRDVELRYTQKGTPVAKIPIAFNRNYKDSSGEWQQESSFIDVVAWSRIAEQSADYLSKGSPVLVQGYLKTRTYETKDNIKRKVTEIIARRVNFLEKSDTTSSDNQDYEEPEATTTDDEVPF